MELHDLAAQETRKLLKLLLDNRLGGVEQTEAARPGRFQLRQNLDWVKHQFDADPTMQRDYLQAAAVHPHLFREDEVAIVSHVEPVVRHFGPDGLTRRDYFQAIAADPSLIYQKPSAVIATLEAVMSHYDADPAMRRDYLQAAIAQPVLLRTPPEAVFASIEAAVDHLTANRQEQTPVPAFGSSVSSAPFPSTQVQNPALLLSRVADRGFAR